MPPTTPPLPAMFDLSGKVAIITGGTRGIGKAIALGFAQCGASVIIASRHQEDCTATADEICAAGGTAAGKACNIGSKDDVLALVDFAITSFGRLDIVVANAASNPHFGPMATLSDEAFSKIFTNNVMSNHWLAQAALPHLKANGAGSIILISSIGGLKGSDMIGAYDISKAADMQLARNLALEFGPHNITVNTIAPGLIRTDFARALWENPDILRHQLRRQCIQTLGEPEDIAGMAVFLASPAGRFATGQTFVIDGGATAI